MLSSRGVMTVEGAIVEALAGPVNGGRVLPITDAHRVWAAVAAFVRGQLLLGNAVTIPKVVSFWCRQRHVAADGPTHYYVREVQCGFCPAFVTTFGMSPMTAPEDPRLHYARLPMDVVAQEAGVPADVAAAILKELFRFIGEGIFAGKVFQLVFPNIAEVHVKREKAVITVAPALAEELFAIDTRKWSPAIRNVAAMHLLADSPRRPSSAASRRPASARSVSTPRPSSTRPMGDRPLFVTALPQGKDFVEIAATPVRPVIHKRTLPGGKVRAAAPTPRALPPPLEATDDVPEESVYDMLSPPRDLHGFGHDAADHYDYRGHDDHTRYDETLNESTMPMPEPERPPVPQPLLTERTATEANQSNAPAAKKAYLFPWERPSEPQGTLHVGRRRFDQSTMADTVKGLMVDRQVY